jgi:hypothetical protein
MSFAFVSSFALAFALLTAGCGGRVDREETGAASGENPSDAGTTGVDGAGASNDLGAASGASSGVSTAAQVTSGASPCGAGASSVPVSFTNEIMPIFQSACSVGGTGGGAECHGDPSVAMTESPAGGGGRPWFGPPSPATSSATALTMIYAGFVSRPAFEDPTMNVVAPGDPTQSFLWYKINGTQSLLESEVPDPCVRGDLGACGLTMPYPFVDGFGMSDPSSGGP